MGAPPALSVFVKYIYFPKPSGLPTISDFLNIVSKLLGPQAAKPIADPILSLYKLFLVIVTSL